MFRLLGLLGGLSVAMDMGTGAPLEESLRRTVVAVRLARLLGLTDAHVSDVLYTSLLQHLGCTAYAHESARLTATNPRRSGREGTAYSSGHGLPSLRHRLGLLGGALRVEDGPDHVVRATVPVDATPRREDEAAGVLAEVAAARQEAEQHARRAGRLAWVVPTALATGAVLVTLGGFLYLSVSSTLSPERFARIEVGMPQHEAEALLPIVEMLEAPRRVLPEPDGARCRYHEAAVNIFVREDVFRICFDDGVVVSTDTIPGA